MRMSRRRLIGSHHHPTSMPSVIPFQRLSVRTPLGFALMVCSFQASYLVAPTFAAAWIRSNTSWGWETIDAWLEGTAMVVAFMRLANICWVAGGMMRSSVEIRYQLGRVFHATAVVGSVKWATLPGFCTVAMMLAWRASTSCANDSRNFCWFRNKKVPKLFGYVTGYKLAVPGPIGNWPSTSPRSGAYAEAR